MNMTTPWHARTAFILALLLPIYFVIVALGTKFGAWSWQTGLITLSASVGLFLMGAIALLALVSLILILRKPPRVGWSGALGALLLVGGLFGYFFLSVVSAGGHPISDVSTDTADPPQFSAAVLEARTEQGANAVSDYGTALSEIEMFEGVEEPLASQTLGQINEEKYSDIAAIPLGDADAEEAAGMIQLVMAEMGLTNIHYNPEPRTVEGVAETFWYGFRDDVVVRVGDDAIDMRSVSRVGRSDLGANAKRLRALRKSIVAKLGA